MRTLTVPAALLAALAVAAPASASVDPSLSVDPQRLPLGETATIQGQSWVVGAGCAKRVRVSLVVHVEGDRLRVPVGRAKVDPSTGGFRLTFTPPESKFRGVTPRARLVARQGCPAGQGGALVRRTRLTLVG